MSLQNYTSYKKPWPHVLKSLTAKVTRNSNKLHKVFHFMKIGKEYLSYPKCNMIFIELKHQVKFSTLIKMHACEWLI